MVKFDVSWSRYDGKFKCIVGHLSYYDEEEPLWEFTYDPEGFYVAYQVGFRGFQEFPESTEVYQSSELFNTFASRIYRDDDSKRLSIVSETEKVELLEETGASLQTDNVEVISQGRQMVYGEN